ncbi:3D domain-containing protein [Gaiella occulta]|uniref:3D domain-containing protein n=1 Tax=Gaiella occulta TaxID=1002870 RepID=UPI000E0A576F|nr:3D domain-containing protein [Gaiella occulta]
MERRSGRRAPLVAAVAAGALIIGLSPPSGGADTVPALRARGAALQRAEQAALLQLYAAESSLARSRAALAALEARSAALAAAEADARRRTGIVRRSLAASRQRLASLLRDLYVQGDADPIAVILGASSLDEAVTGIESLSRAASQSARLGREAQSRAATLRVLSTRLAKRRGDLERARRDARAAARQLEDAVARRASTVAGLRRRRALTNVQIAALEERARAAQRASAKLAAAAAAAAARAEPATAVDTTTTSPQPPDPIPAPQPPGGTRTLVVDAVAYHLPGRTASGIPVGIGVIAVDPTVIPLGTRVFVPGYGPAVAADVGTAIKGAIIDLWMPSTARARAWGRRTVTITIYG